MTGVSRLKRYPALESVARPDERDGRWPLAVHDPLGHLSKQPPKGARRGQCACALRCLAPATQNLLRLGRAEHVSLLQPVDEIAKVLEEIHALPLLDEFRVH